MSLEDQPYASGPCPLPQLPFTPFTTSFCIQATLASARPSPCPIPSTSEPLHMLFLLPRSSFPVFPCNIYPYPRTQHKHHNLREASPNPQIK